MTANGSIPYLVYENQKLKQEIGSCIKFHQQKSELLDTIPGIDLNANFEILRPIQYGGSGFVWRDSIVIVEKEKDIYSLPPYRFK